MLAARDGDGDGDGDDCSSGENSLNPISQIHLKGPNIAVDEEGNEGTFTLIYDEGMEVRISGLVLFAKFKFHVRDDGHEAYQYAINHPQDLQVGFFSLRHFHHPQLHPHLHCPCPFVQLFESDCDQTGTGWYSVHDGDGSRFSCFHGHMMSSSQIKIKAQKDLYAQQKQLRHIASQMRAQSDQLAHSGRDELMFHANRKLIDVVNKDPKYLWQARVQEIFEGIPLSEVSAFEVEMEMVMVMVDTDGSFIIFAVSL